MIEGKVVGIKNVKYTSKKTQALVQGVQLNITYEDKNTDGVEVGTIYISSTAPEFPDIASVKIGDKVKFVTSFQFGRYTNVYVGKIEK